MIKNENILSYTVKQFKFADELSRENLKADFTKLTPDSLYRIYDQLYKFQQIPAGLGKATAPTLVVAGEKEPGPMKQSLVDLTKVLPNSNRVLIKRADHTYPWTKYAVFNKLIRSWINDEPIQNHDGEVVYQT
jgi:pimeloyl-ACP methyl ester carboxylesterase